MMSRFEHGGDVYSHPGVIDFSASLNPLGMPDAAREALRNAVGRFEAYPDPLCRELREAIAVREGTTAERVLACAGATDAFARICSALKPTTALVCAPAYSGYEQELRRAGSTVVRFRLNAEGDFGLDERILREIEKAPDIAFIANPNNPTGRTVDRQLVEQIVETAATAGTRVVIDECFIDFTDEASAAGLLGRFGNLVVVKAFTKAYALAGLRLGHLLCSDTGLVRALGDAGQPWVVSTPAQVAGLAALGEASFLERTRHYVKDERTRLARGLASLGMRTIPSQANYLLFQSPLPLYDALLERGILVRDCGNFEGLDSTWHRVAVRTRAENDALLEALSGLDWS